MSAASLGMDNLVVAESLQAIDNLGCFASQGEFKLLLLSMEGFKTGCSAVVQHQLQGQEGILTLFTYIACSLMCQCLSCISGAVDLDHLTSEKGSESKTFKVKGLKSSDKASMRMILLEFPQEKVP